MGRPGRTRSSATATPPFMSLAPKAVEVAVGDVVRQVVSGRHSVQMTAENNALVTPQLGTGDHRVAEPGDAQM